MDKDLMIVDNEYIITIISIFLISGISYMVFIFWKTIRKFNKYIVITDLIFFFIFVKLSLYYWLPTILRFLSGYQYLKDDGVELQYLLFVYTIEFVSWFFYLITFYFILKILNKNTTNIIDNNSFLYLNLQYTKLMFYIILIGFIMYRLSGLLGVHLPIYFEVFKALFFSAGLTVGPFLLVSALRVYNDKKLFFLGLVSTLFAVISLGTRGALVYLLIFITYLVFFVIRSRKQKIILGVLFGIVTIIFLLFHGLPKGRFYLDENGNIAISTEINTKKAGHRNPIEEVEWRFGAQTRMAPAFIWMYDRGDSAGINPILHSAMGFLPRSINPDKPIPSTLNGDDLYSQGMYLIYREIHGYNTYSMVEFPTGCHFYWEFGWIGVIILSIISAIYIAITSFWFSKYGAIAISMVIATFKPWGYMDPKIWISEAVLQIYQIIIPFFILVMLIKVFYILKSKFEYVFVSISKRRNIKYAK